MELMISLFFGIIGMGYFAFGRKQERVIPLLVGIALGVFPYFISNVVMMIMVGVGLMLVPLVVQG